MRPAFIPALALGLGFALSGCETTEMVDKVQESIQDFNPFGSAKKPLPGQRRAVFPEGVPGVQQGVPPDLMQAQQIPDPNAPAVAAAPAEELAPAAKPQKPKPARTARPKSAKPPGEPADTADAPASRKPAQVRRTPQPAQPPANGAWPAPAAQPGPAQWPAPTAQPAQPAQTVWPDPPKAGTFTR
jgi:hypothetical protein